MAFMATKTIIICLVLPLAMNSVYAHEPVCAVEPGPVCAVEPDNQNAPKLEPGPWKQAHATFYVGCSKTYGGACGYRDTVGQGYGEDTAALSNVMFNDGQKCGACYELKCLANGTEWCKPGDLSIFVTATDNCPPNPDQPNDDGGWCNPPREHFDLSEHAFLQIAEYKGGIVPVTYRSVPCNKTGGIRFTVLGNPHYYEVWVSNVGGAGDLTDVQVMGDTNMKWTALNRSWGQVWTTGETLLGQSLTFRVTASDGRNCTAKAVAPKDWTLGQTFEGINFT